MKTCTSQYSFFSSVLTVASLIDPPRNELVLVFST
jgi:hypothetical protein